MPNKFYNSSHVSIDNSFVGAMFSLKSNSSLMSINRIVLVIVLELQIKQWFHNFSLKIEWFYNFSSINDKRFIKTMQLIKIFTFICLRFILESQNVQLIKNIVLLYYLLSVYLLWSKQKAWWTSPMCEDCIIYCRGCIINIKKGWTLANMWKVFDLIWWLCTILISCVGATKNNIILL